MSDFMDLEEVNRRLREIEIMRRNFLAMVEDQERSLRQTKDVIMRVTGVRDQVDDDDDQESVVHVNTLNL